MKSHKHAELIKAWADGANIQVSYKPDIWVDMLKPDWAEESEYRIKPEPPKYPQTNMTHTEIIAAYGPVGYERIEPNSLCAKGLERVANAAIARAIEDGQVYPADMVTSIKVDR